MSRSNGFCPFGSGRGRFGTSLLDVPQQEILGTNGGWGRGQYRTSVPHSVRTKQRRVEVRPVCQGPVVRGVGLECGGPRCPAGLLCLVSQGWWRRVPSGREQNVNSIVPVDPRPTFETRQTRSRGISGTRTLPSFGKCFRRVVGVSEG